MFAPFSVPLPVGSQHTATCSFLLQIYLQWDSHCCPKYWQYYTGTNPFEYQLSSNLKNAYQELNFFIFKYGVSRKITAFYLPVGEKRVVSAMMIQNKRIYQNKLNGGSLFEGSWPSTSNLSLDLKGPPRFHRIYSTLNLRFHRF